MSDSASRRVLCITFIPFRYFRPICGPRRSDAAGERLRILPTADAPRIRMGMTMRRPYQGQGDNRDLRGPPEPDDRTNQFRNALRATKSERMPQDAIVRFGVLPEPPPRDRKVFAVLG